MEEGRESRCGPDGNKNGKGDTAPGAEDYNSSASGTVTTDSSSGTSDLTTTVTTEAADTKALKDKLIALVGNAERNITSPEMAAFAGVMKLKCLNL